MFKNYKDEGYIRGIKEQNNIMVFIGNGFDISILKKYREDGLVSSYSKFYDFLCYKGFDKKNLLYKKMEEDVKREILKSEGRAILNVLWENYYRVIYIQIH